MQIKDKILIEVATSEWLKKAAKTVSRTNYDDLSQHLLLILCEMNEDKLIKLYNDGYLKLFCIKVMWKQSTAPRQEFFKQVKTTGDFDVYEIDLMANETIEEVIEKENKLNTIDKVVSKNQWYEREIFNQWANGESARSIHRKTKISLREILKVINNVKKQITNEYE